ncbi:hypothetical protein PCANC_21861 [Puccinia coronata f. sp. avenae]|uniref:Plasma membrane proteolipid 3 n=1 Tax=Puccinia coronata f. sp. avenae TaxID=200324 RepID=A0A2N5SDP5_9BASI|nr:hypothetical protein PCANC_21861 [Puccinia coronata f. sp. avenae]
MARSTPSSTGDVLLYFLAIFVPPASVFIKRECKADFWINVALFILGWIPGVIHAWYIISKYPDGSAPLSKAANNLHSHPQPNAQYQHMPHSGPPK